MKTDDKQSKQSTIDDIIYQFNVQRAKGTNKPRKAIIINDITIIAKEDELALKIGFNLLPSISSFSKINLDLYFQEGLINSTTLNIPQTALLNNSLEFPQFLDMKGMSAGDYVIRVEMYEPWATDEKLNFTFKEITVQYTPQTREDRLVKVKIPTAKRVADSELTVVSSTAKQIYSEIEQNAKKESISKRDQW
jgi:hypothetical protein